MGNHKKKPMTLPGTHMVTWMFWLSLIGRPCSIHPRRQTESPCFKCFSLLDRLPMQKQLPPPRREHRSRPILPPPRGSNQLCSCLLQVPHPTERSPSGAKDLDAHATGGASERQLSAAKLLVTQGIDVAPWPYY